MSATRSSTAISSFASTLRTSFTITSWSSYGMSSFSESSFLCWDSSFTSWTTSLPFSASWNKGKTRGRCINPSRWEKVSIWSLSGERIWWNMESCWICWRKRELMRSWIQVTCLWIRWRNQETTLDDVIFKQIVLNNTWWKDSYFDEIVLSFKRNWILKLKIIQYLDLMQSAHSVMKIEFLN